METKQDFKENNNQVKELVNNLTRNNCIAFGNWLRRNYNPQSSFEDIWILRKYDTALGDKNLKERGTTEELFEIYKTQ